MNSGRLLPTRLAIEIMSSRDSVVEKGSTASKEKNDLDISTDARFVREVDEGVEQAYLVKSELGT